MGLRKGSCYSPMSKRPYTRKSRVRTKSYIRTSPHTKISKFIMGNIPKFNQGKYDYKVSMVVKDSIQIRDNSMEASRMVINRTIEKKLKGDYYFIMSAYPHHILRENKMLSGAGADRMQSGMKHSFGKVVGISARIKAGGSIFSVACNKDAIPLIRTAFKKVKAKLSGRNSIVVEEIKK